MPFSRRAALKTLALSGVGAVLGIRAKAAESPSIRGRLRLICVEEHVSNSNVVRETMPEMLR